MQAFVQPIRLASLSMPRLVRESRDLLGLTQQQLAARAGVSRDCICRIECGHGGSKSRDLEAVLNALDQAGVVLLPNGRPDLEGAPAWAIR